MHTDSLNVTHILLIGHIKTNSRSVKINQIATSLMADLKGRKGIANNILTLLEFVIIHVIGHDP